MNIIIAYELFQKGEADTAKLLLLYLGKRLEEMDDDETSDELYLSISDGLKHVLTATFIHMRPTTNFTHTDIQQVTDNYNNNILLHNNCILIVSICLLLIYLLCVTYVIIIK